ncbi:hypothetical protein JGH11_10880 [Dysgonomonas sp. Marseille-P4677]|uniref:hypothetical protein n=1 Tax=Dysgonomonas sp. Marseille-P4677 TaxID=2364790 RepID=UPI0019114EE5|nr:hypothetical protein [Dysgonomonas sp. Marseille-P4677]MBK5721377.1 hypothetical protein [Dysgonomonas sp. Marseille-P4677]
MKIKIKLTIESIIKYELLTGTPFHEIDYTDNQNMCDMLYCTVLCNNIDPITRDEFKVLCENEKMFSRMTKDLIRSISIIQQFMPNVSSDTSETRDGNKAAYIKDVVSTLIVSGGMDAEYIIKRMDLCDIQIYIDAYEKHKREEMESSRLWTFHNMRPHVDSKQIKSPRDIMHFPWEEEQIKKEAELAMERDKDDLERFLKGEMIDLSRITWTKSN